MPAVDHLMEAAAMSVTGGPDVTPREWPVCASYRDDSSSRCKMDSKYLDFTCYSLNDPYKPNFRCSWCQKPLHSARCLTTVENDDEVCVTCIEQTRHVDDDSTGRVTTTAATAATATTKKRAALSTPATRTELAPKRRKKAVDQPASARKEKQEYQLRRKLCVVLENSVTWSVEGFKVKILNGIHVMEDVVVLYMGKDVPIKSQLT